MKNADGTSQDDVFLQTLTQTVLKNLENEQFGVEDLSEQIGMSRSHLHRKLKLLKGKSVSQFIREVRLEEAMKLLQNDVATISEIAYRVGFSSPSYFYKSFQKYYGYPPGEIKSIFNENSISQPLEIKSTATTLNAEEGTNPIEKIYRTSTSTKSIIKIGAVSVLLLFIGWFVFYFSKKENVSSPVEKSIAVLPFDNLSADAENQYFADGIVEDLLNRLSRIEGFKVISRTSSEMYRKKGAKSVPQIAQELGVSYIIEGSVQRDEDKVRINVQLIDAHHDDHICSKLFDRDLNDIFKSFGVG